MPTPTPTPTTTPTRSPSKDPNPGPVPDGDPEIFPPEICQLSNVVRPYHQTAPSNFSIGYINGS